MTRLTSWGSSVLWVLGLGEVLSGFYLVAESPRVGCLVSRTPFLFSGERVTTFGLLVLSYSFGKCDPRWCSGESPVLMASAWVR